MKMMTSKMVRRCIALAMALLVCLSFASCKKGDKDKTSSDSALSSDETSSYNFVLDDDADEPLTSEEEEAVASAWNSIVNDSDAVVIEPYKPSASTDSSSSKVSSTGSSTSDVSSTGSSSSDVSSTNSSSSDISSSEDSSSSGVSSTEPEESSNTSTSSEIPYYPGVH